MVDLRRQDVEVSRRRLATEGPPAGGAGRLDHLWSVHDGAIIGGDLNWYGSLATQRALDSRATKPDGASYGGEGSGAHTTYKRNHSDRDQDI